MYYPNWHAFIQMHVKANVVAYQQNTTIGFISFNKFKRLSKFEKNLLKKENLAFIDQLQMIKDNRLRNDTQNSLVKNQLQSILNEFQLVDERIIHKRIRIRTQAKKALQFEDLPKEVKCKINQYVALQYSSIKCFISKFQIDNAHESFLSIEKTKLKIGSPHGAKTNVITILNLLFELGIITSEDENFCKNKFFELASEFFNSDLKNYNQVLNKVGNSQDPKKIIKLLSKAIDEINTRNLK